MMLQLTSVLLALISRVCAYKSTHAARFTQWFQQFSDNMFAALHENCWANYTEYATTKEFTQYPQSIASDLVSCLLDSPALDEATKANIGSAQVLLGILPTILTIVSCAPAETSMIGLRRPMLAVLITIGSPAPATQQRSFVYYDPVTMLEDERTNVHPPANVLRHSVALSLQLLLVLAAAGNTVELAVELGYLTVSTFAPATPWLVILWTILGVLIHSFGTIALHLRVNIEKFGSRRHATPSSYVDM